jgi:hypothetical protein
MRMVNLLRSSTVYLPVVSNTILRDHDIVRLQNSVTGPLIRLFVVLSVTPMIEMPLE